MSKKFLKNLLIIGLGAEIYHVAEHIYWQTLAVDSSINIVVTQSHNERSILVNSLAILIIIFFIYFFRARKYHS